ncbi:hypothetical protein Q9L58_004153 [Maublancomyces gigas]|uniref:Uncharacterized protein n=1 Tax=Discina gigas TaxID=1032678 RepID=A0ABR3GLL1_9PEZI
MTDADSFYDKLLASIGLPYDEPGPLPKSSREELSQDSRRNDHGRNIEEREITQRPTEPQPKSQLPKSKPQIQPPPKPKSKPPRQKPKPELKPEPRLELRSTPNPISTLPPKPTPSPADLRDRVQSLAKKLSTSAPSPAPPLPPLPSPPPPPPSSPPVTAPETPSEIPSEAPSEAPPLPEKPQAKADEPRKPPATLEAELRRKLLENGRRKRKSSPPEGRVPKADGIDKRRKTATSPPTPPTPPTLPHPPPTSVIPNSAVVEAELRKKLLERGNLIKQKPPLTQANEDVPKHSFDPARKVNRSYSPIEISSDDDEPPSTSKLLSTLPPFLPPRPPPREGFKIRISVPFSTALGGTIALKTEKLPLSTPISSILELFGPARDGDHLYFPGSNPKPTVEIESAEKADLVLGEEGQRFYRDDDDTGREATRTQEAGVSSPKTVVKTEESWHPQSADSSPVGGSSLRGDAMDYVPGSHLKEPEVVGSQWAGLNATLEDIWTRGKKVVNCTLVRAGDGEDDEEEDQGFSEMHPPMDLEDRGHSWRPQHQHQNSRGDFATGIEHQWAEEHEEEGEEGEEEEGDSELWGYNEGYPEGGGPNNGMNWGPGYPMGPGQPPGPWNPEQYPMIPNTNIPDPNTQWYPTQQYPHSSQPSPVFSPHDEGQGSGFMGGGAQAVQAMHWVPGHMDYANAGWMYGYGPNDVGGGGSGVEPTEEVPVADPVNKVVVDGKLPPQGPSPQQPRVQMGIKQKRPRGGRQVKRKERRKGGSGGVGVGRNDSSGGLGVVG